MTDPDPTEQFRLALQNTLECLEAPYSQTQIQQVRPVSFPRNQYCWFCGNPFSFRQRGFTCWEVQISYALPNRVYPNKPTQNLTRSLNVCQDWRECSKQAMADELLKAFA